MLSLARGPMRPALGGAEAAAAAEVAERASTALDHARSYGRVRDISEQLQRTLLADPVQPDGAEVAVLYTPASQAARVGGDWYDAFGLPDGSTMLVIGDVIGHDSAAAAAMGQLRSLTRGIAYSTGEQPAQVLTRVATAMAGLESDTIATAIVAQLQPDPHTGRTRLRFSNAGHPPALVMQPDGSTELLEQHDVLLGLVPDALRTQAEVMLEPGALVLMYTDGLVERRGEELTVGLERLRRVVRAARNLPVRDLVTFVHGELVPSAPDDDVALVALRLAPSDVPDSTDSTDDTDGPGAGLRSSG